MARIMPDQLKHLGLQMLNHGAWCGETPLSISQAQRLISVNPSTEETLAEVLLGDEKAYETIMQRSQEAALAWRQVPAPKRGEVIRLIGQQLRASQDALAWLIACEMGKTIQEAYGEVQEMIDMADFAVGQARMLYGFTMHSERPMHRMYEQWHPYGVIGVITAFNFPVAVWAWNAFIASICGNVVLWKPSSKTPLCAIAVHLMCVTVLRSQQLPPIFSLWLPKSRQIASCLLDDARLPLLSFTGSTQVGKHLAERVAKRLGKSLLELGGNNALIVDETADLQLALSAIVFGAIGTAGQRCTTTRRLFLHASIFETLLKRLIRAYQSLRIGSSIDPSHHMGPLIDRDGVTCYLNAIAMIQSAGGKIVYGGKQLQQAGFFVEPTLVTDLSPQHELVQSETFVPILYVFPFVDIQEAIVLQNAVPQGLSSSLFTQRLQIAEYYLSAMGSDCGIANINIGTSGAEIGGAFGGEKETGGGREAGSDSWKAYMRRQTNTINWGNQLPLAQGITFDV